MRHYRKTLKTYAKLTAKDQQSSGCTFCNDYAGNNAKIVGENKTMFVIYNRVSYDMFEGQRVADHLMVIPKRHVESLDEFTDAEKLDQMAVMSEYEKQGYDIYARGVGNIARSVKHQHTHLIKTVNKRAKFVLFANKPYILIDK
jgi:diadenosine tetraphosphate (Ap4A) HIT family hydrolase